MIMPTIADLDDRLAALEESREPDTPRRKRIYIAADDPRTYDQIRADIDQDLQPGERPIIFLDATL